MKDQIQTKIQEYERARQAAIDQVNALSGAIQALKDLIQDPCTSKDSPPPKTS